MITLPAFRLPLSHDDRQRAVPKAEHAVALREAGATNADGSLAMKPDAALDAVLRQHADLVAEYDDERRANGYAIGSYPNLSDWVFGPLAAILQAAYFPDCAYRVGGPQGIGAHYTIAFTPADYTGDTLAPAYATPDDDHDGEHSAFTDEPRLSLAHVQPSRDLSPDAIGQRNDGEIRVRDFNQRAARVFADGSMGAMNGFNVPYVPLDRFGDSQHSRIEHLAMFAAEYADAPEALHANPERRRMQRTRVAALRPDFSDARIGGASVASANATAVTRRELARERYTVPALPYQARAFHRLVARDGLAAVQYRANHGDPRAKAAAKVAADLGMGRPALAPAAQPEAAPVQGDLFPA